VRSRSGPAPGDVSQSWNPNSYVLNNPLAYVDPSGFQQEPPTEERFEIRGTGGGGEPDITYFGPPVWVVDSPGEAEDPRESAAQAGDIVTPTDVGVIGTLAGLDTDRRTRASTAPRGPAPGRAPWEPT